MNAEQRSFVHIIRKSLERGEKPNPKTIHKLIAITVELDRQLSMEKALRANQFSVSEGLKNKLTDIRQIIIKKVEEIFE